jgi:hypothetical protein
MCFSDLASKMRLASGLRLECVEDSIRHLVDLERIPVHGLRLGECELASLLQELSEISGLVWLRLEHQEDPNGYGHFVSLSSISADAG